MIQVDIGRRDMTPVPKTVIELILEEGPLPRAIVTKWPKDLQTDYVELLALDLQTLGLDEFRRMGRALGEAYLLSLDRPIASDPGLLEAWTVLTGETRPPEAPDFTSS
jgi:hypothetical protein